MVLLSLLRTLVLTAVVSVSSAAPSQAATIVDPTLYDDLTVGSTHTLSNFTIGPVTGPAVMILRHGGWTGTPATLSLQFYLNGSLLGQRTSSGAYFSDPTFALFNISSYITSGLNTVSVLATTLSGGPTSYAVGNIRMLYHAATPVVPLPASLPFLVAGLAMIALIRRRRL